MDNITLVSMFESNKVQLEEKLSGMKLPKDAEEVQQIVSDYFTKVFDSDGEYRQSLTQSEDYILQAAITLLNSQNEITKLIIPKASMKSKEPKINKSQAESSKEALDTQEDNTQSKIKRSSDTSKFVGAAGGAIAGKMLMGGWGAVFGAIAGVAIAIYISESKITKGNTAKVVVPNPVSVNMTDSSKPLDEKRFTNLILAICENVDSLINTYRAQIKRVVSKYEQQEKPTLEKNYRTLLEAIQSLLGYERTHEETEEKYNKKVKDRIEELADLLDNYDLVVVDYDGNNDHLFDLVSSPNTQETRMVYPAIVKDNIAVIPGKVFIPE